MTHNDALAELLRKPNPITASANRKPTSRKRALAYTKSELTCLLKRTTPLHAKEPSVKNA